MTDQTFTRGPGGRPIKFEPLIQAELAKIPDPHSKDAYAIAAKLGCSLGYVRHLITWNRFERGLTARRNPNRTMMVRTAKSTYCEIEERRLRWLAKETDTKLTAFSDRVKKGVSVMAASEFARWTAMSGILDLVLRDDSLVLREKVAALLVACGEWFRNSQTTPEQEESMIPTINRKLEVLFELLTRTREPIEKSIVGEQVNRNEGLPNPD